MIPADQMGAAWLRMVVQKNVVGKAGKLLSTCGAVLQRHAVANAVATPPVLYAFADNLLHVAWDLVRFLSGTACFITERNTADRARLQTQLSDVLTPTRAVAVALRRAVWSLAGPEGTVEAAPPAPPVPDTPAAVCAASDLCRLLWTLLQRALVAGTDVGMEYLLRSLHASRLLPALCEAYLHAPAPPLIGPDGEVDAGSRHVAGALDFLGQAVNDILQQESAMPQPVHRLLEEPEVVSLLRSAAARTGIPVETWPTDASGTGSRQAGCHGGGWPLLHPEYLRKSRFTLSAWDFPRFYFRAVRYAAAKPSMPSAQILQWLLQASRSRALLLAETAPSEDGVQAGAAADADEAASAMWKEAVWWMEAQMMAGGSFISVSNALLLCLGADDRGAPNGQPISPPLEALALLPAALEVMGRSAADAVGALDHWVADHEVLTQWAEATGERAAALEDAPQRFFGALKGFAETLARMLERLWMAQTSSPVVAGLVQQAADRLASVGALRSLDAYLRFAFVLAGQPRLRFTVDLEEVAEHVQHALGGVEPPPMSTCALQSALLVGANATQGGAMKAFIAARLASMNAKERASEEAALAKVEPDVEERLADTRCLPAPLAPLPWSGGRDLGVWVTSAKLMRSETWLAEKQPEAASTQATEVLPSSFVGAMLSSGLGPGGLPALLRQYLASTAKGLAVESNDGIGSQAASANAATEIREVMVMVARWGLRYAARRLGSRAGELAESAENSASRAGSGSVNGGGSGAGRTRGSGDNAAENESQDDMMAIFNGPFLDVGAVMMALTATTAAAVYLPAADLLDSKRGELLSVAATFLLAFTVNRVPGWAPEPGQPTPPTAGTAVNATSPGEEPTAGHAGGRKPLYRLPGSVPLEEEVDISWMDVLLNKKKHKPSEICTRLATTLAVTAATVVAVAAGAAVADAALQPAALELLTSGPDTGPKGWAEVVSLDPHAADALQGLVTAAAALPSDGEGSDLGAALAAVAAAAEAAGRELAGRGPWEAMQRLRAEMAAAGVRSMYPPTSLRLCSSPGCTNLSAEHECRLKLKRCGGCGVEQYCGHACQQEAWRAGHKQQCAAMAAAARQRQVG
ncbi:hypothetical protein HYH03_002238 [Edaphochlamys debaryana]|uniref:MYND-type domain-containing protein n=1 Tax=Edaphochlamys debaryana TaxID=47281 RepID=A0A835YC46_9CHLO|nr:hypothetical protein HYH03_002238 [Edaphochlamys debaryana]|eukprot:KAG2499953.1 hypothetical protein HYH03_002238 [Edaphochlamys debaryana]